MTAPAELDMAALRRLLEEATPGPWHADEWFVTDAAGNEIANCDNEEFPNRFTLDEANARLIVAAVNALPALLSHIDHLTARLAEETAGREAALRDLVLRARERCKGCGSHLEERCGRDSPNACFRAFHGGSFEPVANLLTPPTPEASHG